MTREADPAAGSAVPDEDQQARAGVYSLLGALLAAPPDSGLLDVLRDLQPGAGLLSPAWEQLREAARQARPDALQDEYHALFIGLGRGELAPYGSWYLTGFLMEKPLAQLRADLRSMGFARQEGVAEPEDHAAAVCEVMAMTITENRLTFLEQSTFFATHLGSWLPRFFQDLEQADSASFYRAVGGLGNRFMAVEQEYFAMPA
jgi:TorA maturation chaperone TorD